MASTDKPLGRYSTWLSGLCFVGLAAAAFLPARDPGPNYIARKPAPAAPAGRSAAVPPANPPQVAAKPSPSAQNAPKAQTSPAPQAAPAPQTAPAATAGASPQLNGAPAAVMGPPAPPPDVWKPEEIAAGLRQCVQLLAPATVDIEMQEPMKHGQCGTPAPLLLRRAGATEKVDFEPAPQMNCHLAASLSEWVDKVLQPTAQEVLGSRIKRIVGASSYSCRNIYNNPKLTLSEHATGNAIDIVGFITADGRTILVAKGWGPTERDIVAAKKKAAEAAAKLAAKKAGKDATAAAEPTPSIEAAGKKAEAKQKGRLLKTEFKPETNKPAEAPAPGVLTAATTKEATFLKRLHTGSCHVFSTVLGPEANEAHRDHFHLDVKARRSSDVCH